MIIHTFKPEQGDWKFVFVRANTGEVIVRVAGKGKFCSGLVADLFTERGGGITEREHTDHSIVEFVDRDGITLRAIGGGRMIVNEHDCTITCVGPSTTYQAPPKELLDQWLMDVIEKDSQHRPWRLNIFRMGYSDKE